MWTEQWAGGKTDLQMGQGRQTGVVGWKGRRREMNGRRQTGSWEDGCASQKDKLRKASICL